MQQLAPGIRILIRNEEWLIRRIDPSSDGEYALRCDGVSDLVRGKEGLFLTKLEGQIEILAPEDTKLVPDSSDKYSASLLFLESQRLRTIANDTAIRLGHRGVMNLTPYQLDPAVQSLKQPRNRILIADAVGLGKTLEAAILTTELIQRGRGKRILVVTQKSMLTQFQKEWWSRFSIPLVRLDSVGLARIRNRIPINHNPFNYFDRSIISMDTLKNNLEYRNYLSNAWWDIIVIDECHNVAARAGDAGISRRARLARLLSTRSDTLILLSATPHDGSARSFASLMTLLDPTAISDPDEYTPEDFKDKGLVIRRFKKDIKNQVDDDFPERVTSCLRLNASLEEENAFEALLVIPFTQKGEHLSGKAQELQRIGLQKAIFSSPFAALESAQNRIGTLKKRNQENPSPDERSEISALETFIERLHRIQAGSFSKYQRLLKHLKDPETAWKPVFDDRLVIFSERIETLRWLSEQLPKDLNLRADQITLLHGQMADTEQQEIVDRFGRSEDSLRILLCSDVASEGLNLHYFCHRLIHFDLPWSLMVFQQRNGRVDRFGQRKRPEITYLFTETEVDRIKGDLRILEILQRKDEQANLNLGDPASFLNVFDPDLEIAKVTDFMASGRSATEIESELDRAAVEKADNQGDWLMNLFGGSTDENGHQPALATDEIRLNKSLYADDYEFAKAALTVLSKGNAFAQWSHDDASRSLHITAPNDLKDRLKQLPREVIDSDGRYALTANKDQMAGAIEAARQARSEDDTWPSLHYLWPQHPIMEWLVDRVLSHFGRHSAPVIQASNIRPGEYAFVLLGLIPNRKGQSILVEWQVATITQGQEVQLEPYEDFIERLGIKAEALPNTGKSLELETLQLALPGAVREMRIYMETLHASREVEIGERLAKTLADLKRLQGRQMEQLELGLGKRPEGLRNQHLHQRTSEIGRVFDEYRQWVEDTLTLEPTPYIRVLAAFRN